MKNWLIEETASLIIGLTAIAFVIVAIHYL